jgi:selenocysteine-specific elongation factor
MKKLELKKESKIVEFLNEFDFNIKFIKAVSIYDEKSIENLKNQLYLQ